jgi:hypothetical protein
VGMSAFGPKRTCASALQMSAFGGKADIIQGKTDIKKCLLMTQSGHRFNVGHFSLHDPVTDNRSHGTSAVPEGYLFST